MGDSIPSILCEIVIENRDVEINKVSFGFEQKYKDLKEEIDIVLLKKERPELFIAKKKSAKKIINFDSFDKKYAKGWRFKRLQSYEMSSSI